MIFRLIAIFTLVSAFAAGQISFSRHDIDLGRLGAVSEIRGDVVVRNEGEEKVHLLRATADDGLMVYTSKRTLQPGDTALLVLSFVPQQSGRFSKNVRLLSTDKKGAHSLRISGKIESVRKNDLTACYYFGSGRNRAPRAQKEMIIPKDNAEQIARADTHEMRQIPRPVVTSSPAPPPVTPPKPPYPPAASTGPFHAHVPNNILLLVDISSSMRDSLKLPLMKEELHQLIDAIRDVDSVTLVTYADSVKVRLEAVSGSDKKRLHNVVNSLKARGMTKGKKAILFSQALAQKHYIQGGNNLMIMASDGKFRFLGDDQQAWDQQQSKGAITITTVAFGNDREAMRTLRQIASKGGGSFIRINKRKDIGGRLLEEVEMRSRPISDKR